MKFFTTLSILFSTFSILSQGSISNSKWSFFNEYGLSQYISLVDARSQRSWGNELEVNLVTFEHKRHQLALTTGMFYINRKPRLADNPRMQYLYFPLHLSYKLYSKKRRVYGEFSLGRPMLLYEDSKYFDNTNFWLPFEDAVYDVNQIRKRIHAVHSIHFGYCINKHFALNIGEMSYYYATDKYKLRTIFQVSAGIEFKL